MQVLFESYPTSQARVASTQAKTRADTSSTLVHKVVAAMLTTLAIGAASGPAHAGRFGDILKGKGWSEDAQEIADYAYDKQKSSMSHLGFAVGFIDRVQDLRDICLLVVTRLRREATAAITRNPHSNEADELLAKAARFESECKKRNADLNIAITKHAKAKALAGAGGTGKPPQTPGDESDAEAQDDSPRTYPGWNPIDYKCAKRCRDHQARYDSAIEEYYRARRAVNKGFEELKWRREVVSRINAEISRLREALGSATNDRHRDYLTRKIASEESTLKLKIKDVADKAKEITLAQAQMDSALADAKKHWQALLACLKTCYDEAVAAGGTTPDEAIAHFGPHRDDPITGRKSDYDEFKTDLVRKTPKHESNERPPINTPKDARDAQGASESDDSGEKGAGPKDNYGAGGDSLVMSTMVHANSAGELQLTLDMKLSELDSIATEGAYVNLFIGPKDSDDAERLLNDFFVTDAAHGEHLRLPQLAVPAHDSLPRESNLTVVLSSFPLGADIDLDSANISGEVVHSTHLAWPWSENRGGGVPHLVCPRQLDFAGRAWLDFACELRVVSAAATDIELTLVAVRGDVEIDGDLHVVRFLSVAPNHGTDDTQSNQLWFRAANSAATAATWTYRASVIDPNTEISPRNNQQIHALDSRGDILFIDSDRLTDAADITTLGVPLAKRTPTPSSATLDRQAVSTTTVSRSPALSQ